MQYTENYSLKLPGYGDNADVGDLNDNTTAIDALIHANRQIEAPAFSTDTAYTTGDMCVYENVLYKFTADKAAGNWDSTKVTATNLADEVTDAAQSGGTEVEANPVEAATADLHKLKVENTVYGIPDPTVTKTATGNPIEISDGADAPLVKCVTQITGYQEGSGTPSPDNIRPITAYTEGKIEVSDGDGNTTTHTTTYPSAIFRGSEDVVNGEVSYDMTTLDLGSLEWALISPSGANVGRFQSVNPISGAKAPSSDQQSANMICDGFDVSNTAHVYITPHEIGLHTDGRLWVSATDLYADVATFTAAMNGRMIAYELATPTTSSVTPTNLPIKSLSGYNHIESTTGEMEVEYIKQTYDAIMEATKLDNMKVYSTAEQVVGKWIDGSYVYERTIVLGSFSVGSWTDHTIESSTSIDLLIDYDGYMVESNTMYALPDPSVRIKVDSNQNLIFTGTSSWNVTSGYLTIRYTKTSSNNRSLSKGSTDSLRAEISEEKKEIEELPTTDENTVKKAQNEGEEVTKKTEEPVEEPTEKEENAGESNSENER